MEITSISKRIFSEREKRPSSPAANKGIGAGIVTATLDGERTLPSWQETRSPAKRQ